MIKKIIRAQAILLTLTLMLTACGGADRTAEVEKIDEQFSIGTHTDTMYENTFFDIGFTLPEGYFFLNEEELAQVVSDVQVQLGDSVAVSGALESGQTYFDVLALNRGTNAQINITLTKGNTQTSSLSEEAVIDAGLKGLEAELADMGATDITGMRTTTQFKGESVPAASISFQMAGNEIYERQVAVIRGSYIATVTASSYGSDDTQAMLALFTGVN